MNAVVTRRPVLPVPVSTRHGRSRGLPPSLKRPPSSASYWCAMCLRSSASLSSSAAPETSTTTCSSTPVKRKGPT